MEFVTGITEKDTSEISDILTGSLSGNVKINGFIHTIRDMGEVAFVVLRKREGLVQCVYEKV
jgi:nondiscriminating aspartyl-tRNA synthetase